MRIRITNDANPTYNDEIFIVENTSNGIEIIADSNPISAPVDYLTMARGCNDGNPWSTGNRWFHKDTISASNLTEILDQVATRPIVEFTRDLKLFNYGTYRRPEVHLISDNIQDITTAIHGLSVATEEIDSVVLTTQWVIDQNPVSDPNPTVRILVRNTENEVVNDRVYLVSIFNNLLRLSLETDGLDSTGIPQLGEIFKVTHGEIHGGKEYHFDGLSWIPAQIKPSANSFPLYDLFDIDGVSLADDESYPLSNFMGSRLFTYQTDDSGARKIDTVLGFRAMHDATGQFIFKNYLATEVYGYGQNSESITIPGFYFNRTNNPDPSLNKLSNDWYKAPYMSRQMIVDRFLVIDDFNIFKLSQQNSPSPFGVWGAMGTRGAGDDVAVMPGA
jgi:hypothetical protein